MRFLRSLDLYKFIVLLAAVLLPLGWWWMRSLDESIRLCRQAIAEATKPGGFLEQIGNLQKKVEVVVVNRFNTSDAINEPRIYFQNQILAAGGTTLKSDDFGLPTDPKDEPAWMGTSPQKASDLVAEVTWKRTDLKVPMGFIYAVLFNAESGARVGGNQQGQQSVWKLRELSIVNATDERLTGSGSKTPPAELRDDWSIKTMKFARREPRKQGN
ncbi:MAG TPA: hypothetical protein VFD82_02965 [Planctomycetota bacterium]|nr:hypothetical protein [Planctomycetota bacterium]